MKWFPSSTFLRTALRTSQAMPHIFHLYVLGLQKGSPSSINITQKRTNQLCTDVPWVRWLFKVHNCLFSFDWCLLLVLHPRYKLSYFRSKNWPEEWIDAARTVLWEQWSSYYKPRNDSELDPSSQSSSSTSVCFLCCLILEHYIQYIKGPYTWRFLWWIGRLWHWFDHWRTWRRFEHTNYLHQRSWTLDMVVCDWRIKSPCSYGNRLLVCSWYALYTIW